MVRLCIGLLLLSFAGCGKDAVETNAEDEHEHGDHAHHGDTDLPDDFDPATEVEAQSGIIVSYVSDPSPIPESAEFAVTFSLSAGSLAEADATMPTHGGHGMNVLPIVTDNGDGTYTAEPFEFHMPGYWVIHAIIADEEGNEERVDFDVDCCE